jgi:hypothetical protein
MEAGVAHLFTIVDSTEPVSGSATLICPLSFWGEVTVPADLLIVARAITPRFGVVLAMLSFAKRYSH